MEPRCRKTRAYAPLFIDFTQVVHFQSNLAYSSMSISSKIISLAVTYPYQVVRSRVQVSKYRKQPEPDT